MNVKNIRNETKMPQNEVKKDLVSTVFTRAPELVGIGGGKLNPEGAIE